MRILLLGANGQLGSDIREVFGQKAPGWELFPWYRRDLDISNLEAVQKNLDEASFDVLINGTGYHKTDEVELHATEAFRINAHAVEIMARVCCRKKARFIHVSTDYLFDGTSSVPYRETDSPGPLNVYGASKLMGERLSFQAHQDTLTLRVASLFGKAGASGKGGNFVETMIRVGKEKGEIRVVNDITMSPTSTKTVARALLKLLELKAPPDIYHAVNSGQATWFEFAREIIGQAKVNAEVLPVASQEYPTRARRPSCSVLNNSKLAGFVGPLPHWKDALQEYLREKGHAS